MTHLDTELKQLRASLIEMWTLIVNQLSKSQEALINFDKDLAQEIFSNEKRVDAFELKINMDCENILALFNPVANDLRFVLSTLRINSDLERIGDYAKSIAKMTTDGCNPYNEKMLAQTRIHEMYEMAILMISNTLESFETEDSKLVRTVFKNDELLDKINKHANETITKLIKEYPDDIESCLALLSVIRKLERVGDQTKNIAEEIIFYAEAKVLRHKKKKDKLE